MRIALRNVKTALFAPIPSAKEITVAAEHSKSVAQNLPNLFKPPHAARVAASFFRLLHSAESLVGGASRLFGIHPKADVLLGLSLDMVMQFILQFAFCLRPAQQRSHRRFQFAEHIDLLRVCSGIVESPDGINRA